MSKQASRPPPPLSPALHSDACSLLGTFHFPWSLEILFCNKPDDYFGISRPGDCLSPGECTPVLEQAVSKVSPSHGDLRILGARLSWFSEKSMNGYEVDVRNFVCSIYFDGC